MEVCNILRRSNTGSEKNKQMQQQEDFFSVKMLKYYLFFQPLLRKDNTI